MNMEATNSEIQTVAPKDARTIIYPSTNLPIFQSRRPTCAPERLHLFTSRINSSPFLRISFTFGE